MERGRASVFLSSDPTLRALVALSLGCDVFEGIKNLGPKTIKDHLDKIISQNVPMIPAFKNIMKDELLGFILKKF